MVGCCCACTVGHNVGKSVRCAAQCARFVRHDIQTAVVLLRRDREAAAVCVVL
jgi:hypothetical protein